MEDVKQIFDRYGNKIVIRDWKINIYLKLRDWEKREIWIIKNWKLIVRRDREKHLFQKINWYWYNSDLLHYLRDEWNWDMVVITKQKKSKYYYISTVNNILNEWTYQTHIKDWYEVQIIMPLDLMMFDF